MLICLFESDRITDQAPKILSMTRRHLEHIIFQLFAHLLETSHMISHQFETSSDDYGCGNQCDLLRKRNVVFKKFLKVHFYSTLIMLRRRSWNVSICIIRYIWPLKAIGSIGTFDKQHAVNFNVFLKKKMRSVLISHYRSA